MRALLHHVASCAGLTKWEQMSRTQSKIPLHVRVKSMMTGHKCPSASDREQVFKVTPT